MQYRKKITSNNIIIILIFFLNNISAAIIPTKLININKIEIIWTIPTFCDIIVAHIIEVNINIKGDNLISNKNIISLYFFDNLKKIIRKI